MNLSYKQVLPMSPKPDTVYLIPLCHRAQLLLTGFVENIKNIENHQPYSEVANWDSLLCKSEMDSIFYLFTLLWTL